MTEAPRPARRFDAASLDGLEEPVRRYLRHAIREGPSLAGGAAADAGPHQGRALARLHGRAGAGRRRVRVAGPRGKGADVRWRVDSEELIVAGVDVAPERCEVRLRIDVAGAVRSSQVMRWGNVGRSDYGYIPFGGHVYDERRCGDLTLPSRVSVGRWFGTRRYEPFFEATVLDAEVAA